MKYTSLLIICVLLLFQIKIKAQKADKTVIPKFSVSKKTTHNIPKGQDYTFGYLEVPENRAVNNEKTIKIPVYIFKSRRATPKKDPIIYTVGGPGATTMPSAQYMKYYKYLDDRDFILIEQRGNYYAKPHLDCPEWSQAVSQSNLLDLKGISSDSILMKAAADCRKGLVKKGIDLNAYNTNEIAADINDLVNVLQIEKYNLLTISYSTKIAQVLMRDYPERIRSVVMDSPLPLAVNYDEESVENLLETVHTLLSDCEEDDACNAAFPDIKKRFFDYLKDKTNHPLERAVYNPNSKKEENFYIKGKDLITIFTSASTADVGNVPFEIHKILNNDLTLIKEQLSGLFTTPVINDGIGMRLSVWCAEETPFVAEEIIQKETTRYAEVSGLSPAVFEKNICTVWGVKKVADIENKPVSSAIPVLLINGAYDNETPPKWAAQMMKNLKNSYHIIFKGWKHTPTTNWQNQCAMEAANIFFNNPTVKPKPNCLSSIEKPSFKVE